MALSPATTPPATHKAMRRRNPWHPRPVVPARDTPARWFGDLAQDLRHAARQLGRAPGLTALVVVTLAIGIGATVTMAGVIDRLLFRGPAEVHEPERLARLVGVTPGAPRAGGWFSYPLALDMGQDVPAFANIAAWTSTTLTMGRGPDAPELNTALVSATYFPLLGVRPALGRLFGPGDGFPESGAGGPPLAVLSHGFWQRQFGGDSSVLGRSVQIGQLTYTVVGVAPSGFRGLGPETPDAWLPLTVAADAEVRRFILEDRGSSVVSVVGRLRPGASHAMASEQATSVRRRDMPPLPQFDESHIVAASVIRGRAPDRPREVNVALWLAGVSTLVLLIACANVTNLLLARAFARRREIAVRLALGAGRWRLARQLLVEAGLLATLGAAGALALAGAGTSMIGQRLGMDAAGPIVDARLLAFTMLIVLGTTLVVGLAPMILSALPDLSHVLRSGASSGGGRTSRSRATLLGVQAAICMLLLVVAGLFAQSLRRVTGLDLGLEPDRTLVVNFNLDNVSMTADERDATYAALRERVEAIPGVARVAFADGGSQAVVVRAGTRDTWEHVRRTWGAPHEMPVDSGYFQMLGSSLRGRDFTASDVRDAPPVVIVNAPLAALLFPGEEAIGKCVYITIRTDQPGDTCITIIGVLDGFIYGRSILNREGLLVYTPLAQRRFGLGRPGQMTIALDGPAVAVVPAVRHAVLGVLPDLPRLRVSSMRDIVEPELRPWRVAASMFSLFGLVALAVAAVGLYAVVSFAAAQRTSEIAVRLALGARLRDVMRLVAGEGLLSVMAGLALGIAGALVARRWIGPLLFETSPSDPAVMFGVAALLCGVALFAAAVPTLRAARLDPARVLRED